MERQGVSRVDGSDTLLNDIENDNRLINVRYGKYIGSLGVYFTHVVGVSAWVVEPVGPIYQALRLCTVLQQIIVSSLINSFHFITAESDGFNRPVAVLNVKDLGGEGGNNAKIVASTLHRPPKVGVCVNLRQCSVSQDDVH